MAFGARLRKQSSPFLFMGSSQSMRVDSIICFALFSACAQLFKFCMRSAVLQYAFFCGHLEMILAVDVTGRENACLVAMSHFF